MKGENVTKVEVSEDCVVLCGQGPLSTVRLVGSVVDHCDARIGTETALR